MPIDALQLDLSTWYQFWPNREYVLYTSTRTASGTGGNTVAPFIEAYKRAPSFKELAASGGAYTGKDLVWLIPDTLLPADIQPKEADTITDADGTVWDVLQADWNAHRSHWRLITRDPIIVFDLRDILTHWAGTSTQDAAGARIVTFPQTASATLPCRFQLQSEEPSEERGKRILIKHYDIYVSAELSITHEDQIKDASGNIYEFESYTNRARLGELSVIHAKRDPD